MPYPRTDFENYTGRARRTVFFARYEAGMMASEFINTEHLLLALLREDELLQNALSLGVVDQIRKEIMAEVSSNIQAIPTSGDLLLSQDALDVLAFGADESERLGHSAVDSCHLVLGLLRLENCKATAILKREGIRGEDYRKSIVK